MQTKHFFQFLGLMTLFLSCTVAAASPEEIRESCFAEIQESLLEIGIFNDAFEHLNGREYKHMERKFSPFYKNMSSFGVDLDEPRFDIRIYDWGAQTGYIHPPLSPFPSSKQSDIWEKPAKQNIYAEEYIRDEDGKRHFLGCAYFQIEGSDLSTITRERYLYDGDLMSVTKNHGLHRVWYNQNLSFDLEDKHFVTWKRLFVYPSEAQNAYFNRYQILDAMPSNQVENFKNLFPVNEEGDGVTYIAYESMGRIASTSNPDLMPVEWEENEIFPFNSYYQAIESTFPEVADSLSIHGALSYNGFKKLLAHRDGTERNSIWSVAVDTRDVTRYYIQKHTGQLEEESPVFESFLARIPKLEESVESIVKPYEAEAAAEEFRVRTEKLKKRKATASNEDLSSMTEESWDQNVESQEIESWRYLVALGALVFVVIAVILFFRRKHE